MSNFKLKPHTRRQRTIHVTDKVDRWIESEMSRWGCSYSEAANRLLAAFWRYHDESRFDTEGSEIAVALSGFGEKVLPQLAALKIEVEKVKSNLYLLQMMQDQEVALQGPQPHDKWKREVQTMLAQRNGNGRKQ